MEKRSALHEKRMKPASIRDASERCPLMCSQKMEDPEADIRIHPKVSIPSTNSTTSQKPSVYTQEPGTMCVLSCSSQAHGQWPCLLPLRMICYGLQHL